MYRQAHWKVIARQTSSHTAQFGLQLLCKGLILLHRTAKTLIYELIFDVKNVPKYDMSSRWLQKCHDCQPFSDLKDKLRFDFGCLL